MRAGPYRGLFPGHVAPVPGRVVVMPCRVAARMHALARSVVGPSGQDTKNCILDPSPVARHVASAAARVAAPLRLVEGRWSPYRSPWCAMSRRQACPFCHDTKDCIATRSASQATRTRVGLYRAHCVPYRGACSAVSWARLAVSWPCPAVSRPSPSAPKPACLLSLLCATIHCIVTQF